MPNKYPEKQGWNVPKQKYKLSNWPEYNESLRRRGSIDVWLSPDAIMELLKQLENKINNLFLFK